MRSARDVPSKLELVCAIQDMLDDLVRERRNLVVDTHPLITRFNLLLEQAKEHFHGADMLRLIEPLGPDGSMAVLTVRLSLLKRTLKTELASDHRDGISSNYP